MSNSRSFVLALVLALGCSDNVNLGSRDCGQTGQACCDSANGIYCTQRDLVCIQPQGGGLATCASAGTTGPACGSVDLPCCNINGVFSCSPGTTCNHDNNFCFGNTDGSAPMCGGIGAECCYSANGIYCVPTGLTCRVDVSGSRDSTCEGSDSGIALCGNAQQQCCVISGVARCNPGLTCNASDVCN